LASKVLFSLLLGKSGCFIFFDASIKKRESPPPHNTNPGGKGGYSLSPLFEKVTSANHIIACLCFPALVGVCDGEAPVLAKSFWGDLDAGR
jgi:hypothetical protein